MADTNLLAAAGWTDATDQDYINEFNLSPDEDINKQMFDLVETQNYNAYLEAGMTENTARQRAGQKKSQAMKASAHLRMPNSK